MKTINVKEEALKELTSYYGKDFREISDKIKDICIEYAMRVVNEDGAVQGMQDNILTLSMVADFMKGIEVCE